MINEVRLVGRLGHDPEMRSLANGEAVANLSIATTETWKDKNTGEKIEATEWHRCSTFGKLAEICGKYLQKGSLVYIGGKLKTRKWQDRDGNDRNTTEVIFDTMKMLGGRHEGSDPDRNGVSMPRSHHGRDVGGGRGESGDADADIPF